MTIDTSQRPAMGDVLSQSRTPTDPALSKKQWGLALGTVGTSAIFLGTILTLVIFIPALQRRQLSTKMA